jgi:hypothetical protein
MESDDTATNEDDISNEDIDMGSKGNVKPEESQQVIYLPSSAINSSDILASFSVFIYSPTNKLSLNEVCTSIGLTSNYLIFYMIFPHSSSKCHS